MEPSDVAVSPEITSLDQSSMGREQKTDLSLAYACKMSTSEEESKEVNTGYFWRDRVLFRMWRPVGRLSYEQVILPQRCQAEVLQLAHESSLGGHLGFKKTVDRMSRQFYWPSLRREVKRFCRSCHTCQVVGSSGRVPPVAPLIPLPVVTEPFADIMIDCIGPLPKTKRGNEYLLTV